MNGELAPLMVSFAVSTLLHLAFPAILLVIALTVVRRYRPDAWVWILIPAIAGLAWALLAPGFGAIAPFLASREGDPELLLQVNAASTMIGSVIGAAINGALLYGIYRLGRPASNASSGR